MKKITNKKSSKLDLCSALLQAGVAERESKAFANNSKNCSYFSLIITDLLENKISHNVWKYQPIILKTLRCVSKYASFSWNACFLYQVLECPLTTIYQVRERPVTTFPSNHYTQLLLCYPAIYTLVYIYEYIRWVVLEPYRNWKYMGGIKLFFFKLSIFWGSDNITYGRVSTIVGAVM